MVRLEKQKYWVEDNWFCRYVKVEPPGGRRELNFPCYRWLIGDVKVELREGTGRKGFACIFTRMRCNFHSQNHYFWLYFK